MPLTTTDPGDKSPDSSDRIQDFLSRHGGPSARDAEAAETIAGLSGWIKVYAADGFILRCDWSRLGGPNEMKFTELHPPDAAAE
jgi:hypothetical protein